MASDDDRRRFNNPHTAVFAAGEKAARQGAPVHACNYVHPAMRNSWLKGYTSALQLTFAFEIEDQDQ